MGGEPHIQSLTELANVVARKADLAAEIKADPVAALSRLAGPLQTDVWIYRIVVLAPGTAVLGALVGAIVLEYVGKQTPQLLVAVGSGALGALAGLLAPSPRQ